jgi:hypothetical protein
MNNIYSKKLELAVEALGSKATTAKGIAKYALEHKSAVIAELNKQQKPIQRILLDSAKVGDRVVLDRDMQRTEGYTFRRIQNSDAATAAEQAIGKCGQKSNCTRGEARIFGESHQKRWEKIAYKGQYKGYTGQMLYWDYQSCVGISRSGRSAVVIVECIFRRRIVAPTGMQFASDSNGFFLRRLSDGMDYHLSPLDWMSKDFATRVRKAMAENFKKRSAQKKAEKQAKIDAAEAARIKAIRDREIGSVRVSLDDSGRAGNCVEGSLAFAERKLHLSREDVIAGGYLLTFSAAKLLAVANGDTAAVQRAVNAAWMRETAVTI